MIGYKIKNKIFPSELGEVHIMGSVEEQMEKFLFNRVLSDYAKGTVYAEAENAFRTQIDDAKIAGLWQGEFWGKWVIGAARVCRYKQDSELRDFLRHSAHALISLARDDGYIGTYKNSANVLAPDPAEVEKELGYAWSWNWNVWCRKYTLWGLVEIYMLTEDEQILNAATRFAHQLIDELRNLKLHLSDCGTFNGLPAGSILKPMLLLYRITEEREFFDFCLDEVKTWEREDGKIPNLISNFLANKPIHLWYEKSHEWAKAYEMLSCLEGLLELYRITADEKYLTVCKNAHRLIKKHELNAIFGITCNDMFAGASEEMNSCTEPCDLVHWMRFVYELYTLCGDVEYMDDFEAVFYNPFLAGSFEDGKWAARAVRSSGRHIANHVQAKMNENHCCVNNIPRGYMNFVQSVLMSDGKSAYINMFTDFSGKIKLVDCDMAVKCSGSFLEDGRVKIEVASTADSSLMLRIPEWSTKTEIFVGENKYSPLSASYFRLELKCGVTEIMVAFDMNPRVVDFNGSCVYPDRKSNAANRFVSDYIKDTAVPFEEMACGRRSRLLYGPLILAKSKKCGNTETEIFTDKTVAGGDYRATVTSVTPSGTRVKYLVRLENGEDSFSIYMCDFASGSNEFYRVDSRLFSIWI